MRLHSFVLGAALLVSACGGCCLCDAPYDYCYPTYTNDECGEGCCREHERVGSVAYGHGGVAMSDGATMSGGETIIEGAPVQAAPTREPEIAPPPPAPKQPTRSTRSALQHRQASTRGSKPFRSLAR